MIQRNWNEAFQFNDGRGKESWATIIAGEWSVLRTLLKMTTHFNYQAQQWVSSDMRRVSQSNDDIIHFDRVSKVICYIYSIQYSIYSIVYSIVQYRSYSIVCIVDKVQYHQTRHFSAGFIGDPTGQFQSLANSGRFEKGPLTRQFEGEWGSVRIWVLRAAGLETEQYKLAPDNQKSWSWVQPRAGRTLSSPWSVTYCWQALQASFTPPVTLM